MSPECPTDGLDTGDGIFASSSRHVHETSHQQRDYRHWSGHASQGQRSRPVVIIFPYVHDKAAVVSKQRKHIYEGLPYHQKYQQTETAMDLQPNGNMLEKNKIHCVNHFCYFYL